MVNIINLTAATEAWQSEDKLRNLIGSLSKITGMSLDDGTYMQYKYPNMVKSERKHAISRTLKLSPDVPILLLNRPNLTLSTCFIKFKCEKH